MIEFARYVLSALLFVGFLFALLALPIEYFSARDCRIYEETTGKQTKRAMLGDCYVSVDGEWFTYGEHKARIIAEKGLGARDE